MKSMTGYAKNSIENDNFKVEMTLNSLNSRYLDLKIGLPRVFGDFETNLRKIISKKIKRGKVSIYINIEDKRIPKLKLNENRVLGYKEIFEKLKTLLDDKKESIMHYILRQDDIILSDESDDEALLNLVENCLKSTLKQFDESVSKEGEDMKKFFIDSLDLMEENINFIEKQFPIYKQQVFNNLKENIEKLISDYINQDDHERLLQETAFYVEKSDVNEEIVRLKSHICNFQDILNSGKDNLGKKMKFIIQEMHREANTIGSKFNDNTVMSKIIEMKEEIDKCKEMVFNVR